MSQTLTAGLRNALIGTLEDPPFEFRDLPRRYLSASGITYTAYAAHDQNTGYRLVISTWGQERLGASTISGSVNAHPRPDGSFDLSGDRFERLVKSQRHSGHERREVTEQQRETLLKGLKDTLPGWARENAEFIVQCAAIHRGNLTGRLEAEIAWSKQAAEAVIAWQRTYEAECRQQIGVVLGAAVEEAEPEAPQP